MTEYVRITCCAIYMLNLHVKLSNKIYYIYKYLYIKTPF